MGGLIWDFDNCKLNKPRLFVKCQVFGYSKNNGPIMLVRMGWLESASRGERMGEIWHRMIDTSHHSPQPSPSLHGCSSPATGSKAWGWYRRGTDYLDPNRCPKATGILQTQSYWVLSHQALSLQITSLFVSPDGKTWSSGSKLARDSASKPMTE